MFGAITMLSSLVFVKLQSPPRTFLDGIIMGLEMNFRAALMMSGFSIIGKEMSNPVIRNFFLRTSFRQLPMALEVAFDTLPFAIANLPPFSEICREPRKNMQNLGNQADIWLQKVGDTMHGPPRSMIITGETGSGKTTLLKTVIERLKRSGIPVGGILAPAIFENGNKTGYMAVNVATLESIRLSQIEPDLTRDHTGRYYFSGDAVSSGKNILRADNARSFQVIVIDEIGPLELEGKGWAESLRDLLMHEKYTLLLVVRKTLLPGVIKAWGLGDPLVIDVTQTSVDEAYKAISGFLNIPGLGPPLEG